VPIRDAEGRVAAALNLAVPATRWAVADIRRTLLPRLREAAAAIESDLAQPPPPRALPPAPPEADGDGGRDAEVVQSLQRGLAVIRAFDADRPALTLSEVAKATGLARAAARRFLLTLVDLGYVRMDGRQFRLDSRVLELGRPYLSSLTLPALAVPHLIELVALVNEPATVAQLDGAEIVYVAHAPARRILSISVAVGGRDPAFATALGRMLLAGESDEWLDGYLESLELRPFTPKTITAPDKLRSELERVRRRGFALVDQELEGGLRALAAPIRDGRGGVVAAVNVAVHADRWTLGAMRKELLPRLLDTAAAIQADVRAAT
jgi:IclR family pca regulon transcriptional regulator